MLLTKVLVAIQLINYHWVSTQPISPSKNLVKRSLASGLGNVSHTGEVSSAPKIELEGSKEELCASENFNTPEALEPGMANKADLTIKKPTGSTKMESFRNIKTKQIKDKYPNFYQDYESLEEELSPDSRILLKKVTTSIPEHSPEETIKQFNKLLENCDDVEKKAVWKFAEVYIERLLGFNLLDIWHSAINAPNHFVESFTGPEIQTTEAVYQIMTHMKGFRKSFDGNINYLKDKSQNYLIEYGSLQYRTGVTKPEYDKLPKQLYEKELIKDRTDLEEILGYYGEKYFFNIWYQETAKDYHQAVNNLMLACPFEYQQDAFWKFTEKWKGVSIYGWDLFESFLDSEKDQTLIGKLEPLELETLNKLFKKAQILHESIIGGINPMEKNHNRFKNLLSGLNEGQRSILFKSLELPMVDKMENIQVNIIAENSEHESHSLAAAHKPLDEEFKKVQVEESHKE